MDLATRSAARSGAWALLNTLFCSDRALDGLLGSTVLWRSHFGRRLARSYDEARAAAAAERPDLIVVDSHLSEAATLVYQLRRDPITRAVSIVAIGNADVGEVDLALLESGANAILHLPPGPDWEDRLLRLIHVPARRETRLEVYLQSDTGFGPEGDPFRGQALNLSVNGMLVDTDCVLGLGDDLHFAFQLPGSPGILEGSGTVIRTEGRRHYGLELGHVKGDGRQRIRLYVEGGAASTFFGPAPAVRRA